SRRPFVWGASRCTQRALVTARRRRPCTSVWRIARGDGIDTSTARRSTAEALYSRALGQIDESELRQRMVALRGRVLMRYRMSRHDSVDDLTVALDVARRLTDREAEVEIIMETSTALEWMAEYNKSTELMKEATALADKMDVKNDLLRAELLVGQGRAAWRNSDPDGAVEKLRAAIALADSLGEEAYE